MKSFTPSLIESIALFSVAFPVMIITGNLPSSSLTNSNPSIPGMVRSDITSSKLSSIDFNASFGFLNAFSSYSG